MDTPNIASNGVAVVKIKSPRFGPETKTKNPETEVLFSKELFIAEYGTLRSEISQRIAQQTTLYQIAITAFGLIIGYALEKIDTNAGWFNSVILICVYPLLAFLLSYAWAFNQIRICQIAQYLREREKEVTKILGIIWWENYISKEPSISNEKKKRFPKHGKNKPGAMILSGTQVASILIALILLLFHVFTQKHMPSGHEGMVENAKLWLASCFLLSNCAITYVTYLIIKRSGGA